MDILCKLRRPQYIECTVNESIDFALIPRVELRDQICYISQRAALLPGTIGENIHFANPSATAEAVEAAAKMAGVFWSEEVASMEAADRRGDRRRSGGGGRRGRGGKRRRKGGKRTIATAMVEGIVQWNHSGKHPDGAGGDGTERTHKDTDGDAQSSNGGIFGFLKRFVVTADRKEMESQSGKRKESLLGSEEVADCGDTVKRTKYGHKVLDREIRGNGSNLSGGLKQSIALSRLFLRESARIVICDESFSAMDMVKKQMIYPALFEFVRRHRMALIMVSHHTLECFAEFDEIIVMERGMMHCQGTHQQLLQHNELYRRLCGQQ